MKKKTLIYLACSAFVAFFCVLSCQDSSSGRRASADATAIEGDFATACTADPTRQGYYYIETRTFSGSYFAAAYDIFGDENCKTLVMSQKQTGIFEFGNEAEGGATELDLTIDGVYITLNTASLVQKYNNISYCGGAWELGDRRQVTKKACSGSEENEDEEKDYQYDLVKIDAETLFFGLKTGENDGKNEDSRPASIDSQKPFVKL